MIDELGGFRVGDTVKYTNEYGLVFGPYTIIGIDKDDSFYNRRFYLNKDSYWFPVKIEEIKHSSSPMASGGKVKHADLLKKIDAEIAKHKKDVEYDAYGEEANKIFEQFDREAFVIDNDDDAHDFLLKATPIEQYEYLKERIKEGKKMAHGGKAKQGNPSGVSVVVSLDDRNEFKEIAKKHKGKYVGQQRVGDEVELNFQFDSPSDASAFYNEAKGEHPEYITYDDSFVRKEGGGKMAQKKMEKVMHEFKEGTLRSGSGKKVTDRSQAIAIGLSESGQGKKK